MSNPLSPLSSSFQNSRAKSPKTGSSPFLTKTLDGSPAEQLPSSPLKKTWTDDDLRSPSAYDTNENDTYDEQHKSQDDDFQEPASSPFRYDGREDTVDFQKLQEYEQPPPVPRHRFGMGVPDDPMSSPFRPGGTDEAVDFQKLREVPPMSPGLDQRLALDGPASSPFRPDGQVDPADLHGSPEVQHPKSPGFAGQPLEPESSPFRPDTREEPVAFQELYEPQQHTTAETQQTTAPVVHSSPFRQDAKDNLDSPKLRSAPRASLGLNERRSSAATPRKRSFDQTPQDQEDCAESEERCKKGFRAEGPEIHVDVDEESSVIHNQSVAHDRSVIANSMMEDKRNEGMSTVLHDENDAPAGKGNDGHGDQHDAIPGEDEYDPMDDTGLSNFSALPDMTSFAKLRAESPLKSMRGSVGPATPLTARRPNRLSALLDEGYSVASPTPRRRESRDTGIPGDGHNLLDLTDQMNFQPRQSMQSARYSPSRRSPVRPMRQSIRSPSKLSLLDFDIPPAPTPRSLPTITPRELESLKSGFMSEISSLKATLSGREAEVSSLKQAVADAERRVGEALEEVRNEAARKDVLEIEQAEWERRGKDMERVLQSVRDELEEGERERDRLTRKADEAERSKEKLEGQIVELESQLSAARSSASTDARAASGPGQASRSDEDIAREVQEAVEKVARELHTLYKGKHETKVAALKKSYETRWEKRVREAENKLAAARDENERLKSDHHVGQSESMFKASATMIERDSDEHEAEKHVFEAQIAGLQQEMATLKEDSERLREDLKSERAEKGELVAAVDEWLAIQHSQPAPSQHREREPSVSSVEHPEDEAQPPAETPTENPRRSVSRSGTSGIRPPATNEKRIPRYGAPGGHSRGNSGGKSGIAIFTPGRGGIMSSIERMGRGGA
ncbi:hypothetical protein N7492_003615 [Penicillium capsulatum]|uniref:Uncharacterized protein n=1 Tax=Penicillium capsulatum TaxID=69766 RepID=A0A9W9INZ1_9EURO|nr:hypothetical protein N7492_003615 [Penicillium capsulatum]KAJ6121802.1 hypothetical protein N7512_004267 [Penicillium capsulatum]